MAKKDKEGYIPHKGKKKEKPTGYNTVEIIFRDLDAGRPPRTSP